jgi:uncharacterized membrane protein YfcA
MSGLAASPLGALIGLLMGALGGGGSLIAIPVLVYLVGQDVRAAQATALVIVIVAAIAGIVTHAGRDGVRWRAGMTFGLAAGVSAFAGSVLNRGLDEDLLLLLFAPVMVVGAWAMVSEQARRPATFRPWRLGVSAIRVIQVIALGLAVGLIVGLFGVGGGFIIVPVLVLALRLGMAEAVGTSLLIITISAAFALGDRIETGDVEWAVAIPFSAAATLGAIAGQRLGERVGGEGLRRTFAVVVVLTAAYMASSSAIALSG